MSFLLRLVGAFLAACACVALAWVLGPAGLLLPAVVIVMVAFSGDNSRLESASIIYSIITIYLLISLSYAIVVTFNQYYLGEEQYELVRVYIDYQVFQPVFADKSFFEPEGLIHSENAMYDNLAYLTSHLGLFLLVFLGIFRFGEIGKALRDIDEKFDEAGKERFILFCCSY